MMIPICNDDYNHVYTFLTSDIPDFPPTTSQQKPGIFPWETPRPCRSLGDRRGSGTTDPDLWFGRAGACGRRPEDAEDEEMLAMCYHKHGE